MVSFNSIPNQLRAPFVAVEFDNTRAVPGSADLPYRALLIGQALKSAAAVANSLVKVTSADQVASLCGRGSQLHRMALAWFAGNTSTETWIGVLADSSAGVYASGTLTITGPATADGVIDLYVGGVHFSVAVASGDSASTIAGNIASALGKHASGTVTFASAQAADNITVGSTTFVGTSGAVVAGEATYSIDTGNNAAAASFVAQVKAHAVAGKLVAPSANNAVVTLRAIAGGPAVGNAIVLTSTNGTRVAVSGSGTLAGATADTDASVHATVSSGVVTILARNNGLAANELDIRLNYRSEHEALPAGVGATIVAMSGGTTNPTLTTLIAAMGDRWYQVIAHPYTDATSLTALENEMASRFGPMRMIPGMLFTAKNDTYSNVATLGEGRNSAHSIILRTNDSPTPPLEYAAHVAAVASLSAQEDPARPMQTLPLPFILPPAEADIDTLSERNLLLFDGIATTRVGAGDQVQIDRLITTYQTAPSGSPDASYLDSTTLFNLMYLRFSFVNWMANRYPRHKLAPDGTRFGAGQAVMSPSLGRAEAVAWFREMERKGLVVNFDQFKAELVVEINGSNPNRLDFLLPPSLIGQLTVMAAQIQFLLG